MAESQEGAEREQWRRTDNWIATYGFLNLPSHKIQNYMPTVNLAFPHQSPIKKMSYRLTKSQYNESIFSMKISSF